MWEKWPRMSSRKCPGNSSTDEEPLVSTSATDRWEFEKATQQVHTGEQQNIKIQPAESSTKKGQVWRELLLRCKIKQHAILLHSNHQIEDIDPRMLQKHHVFKVMLKGNHIFETDSHDVSHVQGDLRQILGTSFPVPNLKIYILSTHTHPPLKKHTRTACPNQKKKNAAYSRFGHLRGAIG